MKLAASVIKSLKENIRDWKVLVVVLSFSPFFVLLMYLFYGSEPTTYKLGISNHDTGKASLELIRAVESVKGQDGSGIFKLSYFNDQEQLKAKVKDKAIDIGMVIPADYSGKLSSDVTTTAPGNPAIVHLYGSMGNSRYMVAAVLASNCVYMQGMDAVKINFPTSISETFLEKKQPLNEFEGYVPGLISLAVLMIFFTACASIVKENDKKTLTRLKLSRLGAFNFLAGICIVQAVVAAAAIVLSYWTAVGLGYKPVGGFGPMLAVGIVSSFSMVAVSLLSACFFNTIFDVMTIGCFPFFILMFFSGGMFPLPKMDLFVLGGHQFGVMDILPLTHTVNAFNKILNYGESLSGAAFDIFMIMLLTLIYFTSGLVIYQRRKLSKA